MRWGGAPGDGGEDGVGLGWGDEDDGERKSNRPKESSPRVRCCGDEGGTMKPCTKMLGSNTKMTFDRDNLMAGLFFTQAA